MVAGSNDSSGSDFESLLFSNAPPVLPKRRKKWNGDGVADEDKDAYQNPKVQPHYRITHAADTLMWKVSGNAWKIYCQIVKHSDNNTAKCHIGVRLIRQRCMVNAKRIKLFILELVKAGLIKAEIISNKWHFQVIHHHKAACSPAGSARPFPGREQNYTKRTSAG